MTKLLLIEANGNAGEDLLRAAAALGVRTLVATHADLYDNYPPSSKDLIAGTVFTDFSDLELARKALVAYGREEGVEGVITGWEFFSGLATQVAADLGLPSHDPELALATRNKRAMAEAFERAGAPAPRTVSAATAEELAELVAAAGIEYPLVVKPAENAGSIGVTVVRSADDLARAVEFAQGWPFEFPHGTPLDNSVLAQEYVGGVEFSVESAVVDGRVRELAITQKFTTADDSRAELGHTVPAELSSDDRATLLAASAAGLAALGFRHGIAHAEIKLVSPGTARIIEIGARPPGDHIMKLVRLATGVSEAAAYIQIALGRTPDLERTEQRAAAIRFLTPPRAGVFRGVRGIPDSEQVVEAEVYAEPGKELGAATDNVARVGYVIVTGGSTTEANELANDVVGAITVEVDPR
ncbi:ATP-grasp domain-containing protein [Actinokineospora bangkokensis]|uniref:Carboxylase n=1 Tax=Actinokineospora bangkokensis TaxID=1193682 RepID=A0A1Q9LNF7_9PSEU|nr:ATP-grasp domain-containing protein [Actinokineospora bangkokensis]OLR93587.1 carboxylase [Actinokineospora bangkokensis]